MGPIDSYNCKIRLQFPISIVSTIISNLIRILPRELGIVQNKFSWLLLHFLLDSKADIFVCPVQLFQASNKNYSSGPIHLWRAVCLVVYPNWFSAVFAQRFHLCFPKTDSEFSLRLFYWKILLTYWTFCWKYWIIPFRLKTQFSWCNFCIFWRWSL